MIAWIISLLTPQVIAGIVSLAVVGGTWWFKTRTRQARTSAIKAEIEKVDNPDVDYVDPRLLSQAKDADGEKTRVRSRAQILADLRKKNI